jgi:hypothetical protein
MAARTEIERVELGRLERLDLRSFWGEQLPDLTPWFLQNVDLLSETLGIDITPLQRDINVDTGAFNVLGSDALGRPIVIANRLEATDHSQLGQLIVEASGLETAVVIWVAPHFREEFRRGLEWLNERTDQQVDFFGVEIGLVRIGRSLPAPVLDVVVQPRNWRKASRRRVPMAPPAGRPAADREPPPPTPEPAVPLRGRHESPSPAPEPPPARYDPPSPPRYEAPPEPPPAQRYEPPPEPAPARYEAPPEPAPAPGYEPPTARQGQPAEPPPAPYESPAPPPQRPEPQPAPPPARYQPQPAPPGRYEAPQGAAGVAEPLARTVPAAPAPGAEPPPMASEKAGGLQPVELRHRFFEAMFDSVAVRRPGFRIPKFGYENWVGFAAGPFGFYDVAFTANGAVRAGIYLDMQERTSTKRLFDDLYAERLAVETAVGRILSWERLDDRRASRIVDYREIRDLDSREERRVVADWAAETVVRLMEALDDRLRSTAQVLLSRVQGGV